jgi:hypothetical protein
VLHACGAKISLDLLREVYGDLKDSFEDEAGFPISIDAMFAPVATVATIPRGVEMTLKGLHGTVDGPAAHLGTLNEISRGPGPKEEARGVGQFITRITTR